MDRSDNKILVITRDISYPGGTEYFLYDYLQYISSRISPEDIYLLEIEGSGKFANSILEKNLKEIGINVLSIPDNIAMLEYWDALKLLYVDKLVTQIDPKIIHSFLFNADFIAYYLMSGKQECTNDFAKVRKIKNFRTFYPGAFKDLPDTKIHQSKWISSKLNNFSVALEEESEAWLERKSITDNYLEPIVSRKADTITVVANESAGKWASWSTKPPILIPCSAIGKDDLASIDNLISKTRTLVTGRAIRFICVSRLVAGKGIEDLITSFKKVITRNPDVELALVGDGDRMDMIKEISAGVPQIKVLGFMSRESVLKQLALSDIFVLASYSEGLPLSIQEAMASCLPIIATNVGGISNLVTDEENGFLFSPGDTDILSKTMLALSLSPDAIKQMGQSSRAKLEKSFLKENSYRALLKQYIQR